MSLDFQSLNTLVFVRDSGLTLSQFGNLTFDVLLVSLDLLVELGELVREDFEVFAQGVALRPILLVLVLDQGQLSFLLDAFIHSLC